MFVGSVITTCFYFFVYLSISTTLWMS